MQGFCDCHKATEQAILCIKLDIVFGITGIFTSQNRLIPKHYHMPLSLSIQSRLRHQHETLAELIKGLTEEQLKQRANPAKWSAFENIVHLASYQPVFYKRLQLIEQQDNPAFERYVADNDPVFQQYAERSLKELLENLTTERFLINNHIFQLSETVLRRHGTHPLYGSFSISQWSDFFLLHEAHHLFTIFMLTAATRKSFQH